MANKRIMIGIPCYSQMAPEAAFDYMRMCYNFGRRYPDYDFFLSYKLKSEQFRARNNIVEGALTIGADYLLFLDDDQRIDWGDSLNHDPYMFLQKMLDHKVPIVGGLYYHRDGDFRPVIMKKVEREGKVDAYTFYNDAEITGGLQEVDVQGGGFMLIDMKIFDKIKPPYFEPEMVTDGNKYGTDIQLCRKAKENGFSVYCDTSIVVGHVSVKHETVTPLNRDLLMAQAKAKAGHQLINGQSKWLDSYRNDVLEYLDIDMVELTRRAQAYNDKHHPNFEIYENKNDYYIDVGKDQLCRQLWYHTRPAVVEESTMLLTHMVSARNGRGLDFGCGTAPVGFELLKRGHSMTFIDVEGAEGYEFLKWRIKKHGFEKQVDYKLAGEYDFSLMLDSIEHLSDWEYVLDHICGHLKNNGVFVTNFFRNTDFRNVEHINMDHDGVGKFLTSRKLFPASSYVWTKKDNFMGGPSNVRNIEKNDILQPRGSLAREADKVS